jgi:hypothetical protein
MKPKTNFNVVIATATLFTAALIAGGAFIGPASWNANAQLTASNATNNTNTTKGGAMMGSMTPSNITGSLKLSTILGTAFSSAIKVSLSQAITKAETAVGNNSHALAGHVDVDNGYLVYTVWIVDGSYNFHRVVVDAGNAKVLADQKISKENSMMMRGMMMNSMMMGGPGHQGMLTMGGPPGPGGVMSGGAFRGQGMMMGGPGMAKQYP